MVFRNPDLLDYFVRYEVWDRVFTGAHDRNPGLEGALEVYVPTLIVGTLPWSGAMWNGLRSVRSWHPKHWRRSIDSDPIRGLLVLWFAIPFCVFLLANSRLVAYVLPLFVPLSFLLARRLPTSLTPTRKATIVLWVAMLVGVRWFAAGWDYGKDSRAFARVVAQSTRGVDFDEIVFIDTWPRYGLSMYLDAEVEPVFTDESYRLPYAGEDTLDGELLEDERRIFAAEDARVGAVRAMLGRAGYKLDELGHWNNLVLFQLVPGEAT